MFKGVEDNKDIYRKTRHMARIKFLIDFYRKALFLGVLFIKKNNERHLESNQFSYATFIFFSFFFLCCDSTRFSEIINISISINTIQLAITT